MAFSGNVLPEERNAVVFSPDGKLVASSAWGRLELHQVSSGKLLRAWESFPAAVAFSTDSKLMAFNEKDGLKLWDIERGTEVCRWPDASRGAIAISPDGTMIAINDKAGNVQVHSLGRAGKTVSWPVNYAAALAFSPNGKTLAVGTDIGAHGMVRCFDAYNGQVQADMGVIDIYSGVKTLAFAPNGRAVFSVHRYGELMRLVLGDKDHPAGTILGTVMPADESKGGKVTHAQFSPDITNVLVSIDYQRMVNPYRLRIIDVITFRDRFTLPFWVSYSYIGAIALSPDAGAMARISMSDCALFRFPNDKAETAWAIHINVDAKALYPLEMLTLPDELTYTDKWNGLGRPRQKIYQLIHANGRYSGNGIIISEEEMKEFIGKLRRIKCTLGKYSPEILIDNYPDLKLVLTTGKQVANIYSTSVAERNVPWGVTIEGLSYSIASDEVSRALEGLLGKGETR